MFYPGDVVRVKPEWLDKGENPETDYIIFEDYGDGKIKVFTKRENSFLGGSIHVWPDYTVYKIGWVDLEDKPYQVGDKLKRYDGSMYEVIKVSKQKNEIGKLVNYYTLEQLRPVELKGTLVGPLNRVDLTRMEYKSK